MIIQGQFFQGLYGGSSCLLISFHHYFLISVLTCLLSHCCSSSSDPLHGQVKVDYIASGFHRNNSAHDGNKAPCA